MVEMFGALAKCRGCGYAFKPAGLKAHVREMEACAEQYEPQELVAQFGMVLVGV